jgi:hypothetical protein
MDTQVRFLPDIQHESDYTLLPTDDEFLKFLSQNDTVSLQKLLSYVPTFSGAIGPQSYVVVYEFSWYSDESVNIREKRVRVVN